jgi:hypothetical protein
MTQTPRPFTAYLVVRAWREPEGPLCTRVGAVTDPEDDVPTWEPCVGVDQTLAAVRSWLQRWSLDTPASAGR